MISVREGIGYRVMGDYMAYWHEVYTGGYGAGARDGWEWGLSLRVERGGVGSEEPLWIPFQ